MHRHFTIASLGILLAATVAASAFQQSATLTLRSGATLSGELVDLGGAGFTFRVNGEDRNIPKGDVASIDFGGENIAVPAAARSLAGGMNLLVLRNGDVVTGEFYDVGGASPIRVTFRTSTGERVISGSDIRRIYMTSVTDEGGSGGGTPVTPTGTVAVRANQQWNDTGHVVRAGEMVRFTAEGQIKFGTGDAQVAGPDGNAEVRSPRYPVPAMPVGGLIARVGTSDPFPIGTNTAPIRMPRAGRLFLGVNDDGLGDNSGQFTVRITRSQNR